MGIEIETSSPLASDGPVVPRSSPNNGEGKKRPGWSLSKAALLLVCCASAFMSLHQGGYFKALESKVAEKTSNQTHRSTYTYAALSDSIARLGAISPFATEAQEIATADLQPQESDVIFITGAMHNIGQNLMKVILAKRQEEGKNRDAKPLKIVAVGNFKGRRRLNTAFLEALEKHDVTIESSRVDITNYDALEKLLASYNTDGMKIQGVVHLAAVSRVQDCQSNLDRCRTVNVQGTENILKSLVSLQGQHRLGISLEPKTKPWFLFASSREVYGELGPGAVATENVTALNPINPYGETKLQAEEVLQKWRQEHGLNVVVLRFTNVYGSCEDHLSRLVPTLVSNLVAGKELQMFGSATRTISMLHVDDAVEAIMLGMNYASTLGPSKEGHMEMFNVGGGPNHDALPLSEIVKVCQTSVAAVHQNCQACLKPAVVANREGTASKEPDHFRSNVELARKVLGFQVKHTFDQQSVQDYVQRCHPPQN